ncbi:hypothetical protein EJB05_51796, partial [Eragrostis curvula]
MLRRHLGAMGLELLEDDDAGNGGVPWVPGGEDTHVLEHEGRVRFLSRRLEETRWGSFPWPRVSFVLEEIMAAAHVDVDWAEAPELRDKIILHTWNNPCYVLPVPAGEVIRLLKNGVYFFKYEYQLEDGMLQGAYSLCRFDWLERVITVVKRLPGNWDWAQGRWFLPTLKQRVSFTVCDITSEICVSALVKSQWSANAGARHVAKMLKDLVCLGNEKRQTQPRTPERWKPPDPGWVKVNTDGAFRVETGTGATGAILRNEEGITLAVEGRWLENLADAVTAEAMAVREGLLRAVALGCDKVILEIDNISLANSIQSGEPDRSAIFGLWHEIQELSRSFSSFAISFVRREANSAAHCCAKMPTASNRVVSCVGYTPNWMMGVVTKDCNPVES